MYLMSSSSSSSWMLVYNLQFCHIAGSSHMPLQATPSAFVKTPPALPQHQQR
jgi:hypothetical protein